MPICDECGKNMQKIIVDFEEDGKILTAYECRECQTIKNLSTQDTFKLKKEGMPIFRLTEEITGTSDGILSLPLDRKMARLLSLKPGQKVETVVTDNRHILITL
ncbi:MAG: hypothetical protein ABIF11_00910 [Nitrospirota bacterium]